MSAIVVDEELGRAILRGEAVEIRTASGEVVGTAKKRKWTDEELAKMFGLEKWPTPEEEDAYFANGPWYTTEEVMERLRSLTKCE